MESASSQEPTDTAEELVTVKEFAYLFGYHPNSVWRRVREGRMPNALRDGRSVRIRLPAVLVRSLRARSAARQAFDDPHAR